MNEPILADPPIDCVTPSDPQRKTIRKRLTEADVLIRPRIEAVRKLHKRDFQRTLWHAEC